MTLGSLFAGIGGFDLGFEQAGFQTLWQVEIDKSCLKLLASKFPKALRLPNVTKFHPASWKCPDVITFGFPCQDLSVAGQRNGLKNGETRSGLFYEACRIIAGFVPRGLHFAIAENVPGLFSSDERRDFARVLGSMGQLGARDIAWTTLDCQYWGLAQRRKRVFIVVDFRGERAEEILSLREGLCRHPAPSRETRERIAPTIEGRTGRSGVNNFATSGGLAHSLRAEGADASEDGTGRGTPLVCGTINAGSHPGSYNGQDVYNDMLIPTCARRLRAQAQSSHHMVRRLTPRECERLMGFPDDYTAGFSDSVRYRMLGNSVAVPVAKWLAQKILASASQTHKP